MNPPSTGRRVLVSGASRGLGRAVARAFAACGGRVAVHYGSREDEARRTLDALPGTGHVLVGRDLSEPSAAADVAERAFAGLGGIDVPVNNAAWGHLPRGVVVGRRLPVALQHGRRPLRVDPLLLLASAGTGG